MHLNGPKPPGKSAFSIKPIPQEEEGTVEILDSLPLRAVEFDHNCEDIIPAHHESELQNDWRKRYLYWSKPNIHARREIGDCYALVAEAILTLQQPYPGDELFDADRISPEWRFGIFFRKDDGEYTIHDCLVDTRVSVSSFLLTLPKFDLARWYAAQRIKELDLGIKPYHQEAMGYPVHMVATKLLTDSIASHYPCTNVDLDLEDRFLLYHFKKPNQTEYFLNDNDLEIIAPIPRSLLPR